MTGIDPTSGELAEAEIPPGAVEALNFFGEVGYTGPCPIPGNTSTFKLTVHALGQQLETFEATPAAEVLDLVGAVTIDSAVVSGTVTR
jgi:phosphatidylethanolamine-binding protein (PEBP) family uncharacterized protein